MLVIRNGWWCKIFGHSFKKVKDLRGTFLDRERVIYRCQRCGYPLIVREPDRRQKQRRMQERRQNSYLDQYIKLKYTT